MDRKKHKTKQPNAATLQPRMLNVRDAATYLGSTVWFVRNLVWDRKLPRVQFGKRLVFDRADLDAFIETKKKEGS
jgi:excisionase family DNA binding protein